MIGRLTLITPPTVEPVTITQVKMNCHIDDSTEDDLISEWIKSGRELAEIYTRRSFINQVWEYSFDYFPEFPIELPRSPVSVINSITYYDYLNAATVYTSSNYILDKSNAPARIGLEYGVSIPSVVLRGMNSFKINYTSGYGTLASLVPSVFKDAIIIYCAYRNGNRECEIDSAPKQFFNLLNPKRMYL
jgi:uncharacterized phiE125 gp8 family phage protein